MTSVSKILYIVLMVLIATANLSAQDVFAEQFNYAKRLYEEEKYFDAVTEFKRLLFFYEGDNYSFESNLLIGLSYKEAAKFSEAIQHFTLAELNSSTEYEVFESRIEIIKVNILRRTTQRAFALLDSLENDVRFRKNSEEINYWRGWAYIFSDDWKKAASYFSKLENCHQLSQICDSLDNDLYNPQLVKFLSIVPGAGQFYTGEYVSGLISIGWNVLWGYLTINAFMEDRVFDGLMVGTLLWWRFYSGNIQNAEKFAIEKNLKMTNLALRYLQNDYSGKKP
ncbi:MAG: TTC39/IML2 family protein [Ignavibacteriaceae bacterium]|nr:TTC39/IML2 family protein [Ignavibacteriaceae bacterium]